MSNAQVTILRLEQWDLWEHRNRGYFSPSCSWCHKVLQAGDLTVIENDGRSRRYFHSDCFNVRNGERSQ